MIPNYQKYIFTLLLVGSLIMAIVLWNLRERAHQRLVAGQDSAPTQAPQVAPSEQATLVVANDSDSSLLTQVRALPLPADPGSRARAVLGKLLDLYAAPDSTHPVPGGAGAVAQVFLLPAPELATAAATPETGGSIAAAFRLSNAGPSAPAAKPAPIQQQLEPQSGPQMAVVNLTGSFVASHPSGIETETLTVLSICGTLHANLPRVTQVRFLVDGQPHSTLAGHADLTRTYLAADAVSTEATQP